MVGPVAQAQPAELAAALAAHHVHAPLVLLYGSLALGAGLGVGQDPVGVLTLRAVLAQPHVDGCTIHLLWTGQILEKLLGRKAGGQHSIDVEKHGFHDPESAALGTRTSTRRQTCRFDVCHARSAFHCTDTVLCKPPCREA